MKTRRTDGMPHLPYGVLAVASSRRQAMITTNQRETLSTCLAQIFGHVDDAFVDAAVPLLEWRTIAGGETLMRAGDPSDGVFLVISGRLRAFVESEGETRAIGEIGRGETVGEMGVMTGEARTATVVAIRDSVLARASHEAFEQLLQRDPKLPMYMSRIVIERVNRSARRRAVRRPATIAVLPVSDGIDIRSFATTLTAELQRWGSAILETRDAVDRRFGAGAAETTERDSDLARRVAAWLEDAEQRHEFIVLLTDGDSEWTRRCLRQADEVLLVARGAASPRLDPLEEKLCAGDSAATRARQTLVLLHDEASTATKAPRDLRPARATHPRDTARWLDRRPVAAHVHVRPTLQRDMARLARVISGNAIGLVLAGGGARGFAHLGVYKALEEAGIEVDFVGGTSMGAVLAAYVSLDLPADQLIRTVRSDFAKNPTGDVNWMPMLSLIKGHRLRAAMEKAIVNVTGSIETDVADTWKTLYCVASNYSSAREVVITRGRLDRAVRASVSIPVALPPVVWNGELLVDGAIFNNFPADVMAKIGAGRIIGVDLSRRSTRRYDFEEMPSTWQLLLDRFRPWKRRRYKLPTLGAFMMRTTILYSESRSDESRDSVDLYLNPDLSRVALLDWKSYDRIVELGYRYAKELLASMPARELAKFRNEPADSGERSA